MDNHSHSENKKSPSLARFVRLTQEEHDQLKLDESRTGRTAQELLKKAYFGNGRVVVLVSQEDKDAILVQINRIGNNVNQIAKKLNTGVIFGFDQELTQVRVFLTHLMQWINGKYNNSKEQKERL